jgi:hypothetical protein
VQLDGEALVMHVGDKPYVVSPNGQVDLATRGLALDAVVGIVNQLLPMELQRTLDEFGAAQYDLPPLREFPGEHFTIVAARGGDDVWAEIRRRRIRDDDRVPMELFGAERPARAQELRSDAQTPASQESHNPNQERAMARSSDDALSESPDVDDTLAIPDVDQLWPDAGSLSPAGRMDAPPAPAPSIASTPIAPAPPAASQVAQTPAVDEAPPPRSPQEPFWAPISEPLPPPASRAVSEPVSLDPASVA